MARCCHLKDIGLFSNAYLAANAVDDPLLDQAMDCQEIISKVCEPISLILVAFLVQQFAFGQI